MGRRHARRFPTAPPLPVVLQCSREVGHAEKVCSALLTKILLPRNNWRKELATLQGSTKVHPIAYLSNYSSSRHWSFRKRVQLLLTPRSPSLRTPMLGVQPHLMPLASKTRPCCVVLHRQRYSSHAFSSPRAMTLVASLISRD